METPASRFCLGNKHSTLRIHNPIYSSSSALQWRDIHFRETGTNARTVARNTNSTDERGHRTCSPSREKVRLLQQILPGSYSLPSFITPHTHTKCMDAALAPLRLRGIRILNYMDDWLILAKSREVALQHKNIVLAHLLFLGLRLNAKKSVLSHAQRMTYLGIVWDSITMRAHLSPARIEAIQHTLSRVRLGQDLTVK